ncbi:MAG: hypothetical protein B7Y88_13870 [Sphingomonadales bacterium 32-64-17]|nr:MAG: hypothetical protein B7Y88_13870 [Sphingomonadales bacterium 32-64-17]
MAFTAKFTGKYGDTDNGEIAVAAGSAEAQSDTISLNIDATNMSKGEALQLIEKIRDEVHNSPWPPLA